MSARGGRRTGPRTGDVFLIPTGDGRAGVGQSLVTFSSGMFVLGVFTEAIPWEATAEQVTSALASGLLFEGVSMDGLIYHGDWPVVDNRPVDPDLPLPAFKETIHPSREVYVVDYDRKRRRPATEAEAAMLSKRNSQSPMLFQNAFRAWLGLDEWKEYYDLLRVENIVPTRIIFGNR